MSDWTAINKARIKDGPFATDESHGWNGAAGFWINALPIKVIFSDGGGWRHVSVSIHGSTMTPSWDVMSKVKDLFWDYEDCVVEFHPPKSEYVNCHPGCLHLWQCTDGREQPTPPSILVGIK